jgi:hypothetical protein
MSTQQQTVLRVQLNNGVTPTQYEFLDQYSSIPIKITKSFAELQDVGKKNSDTALSVLLPGSKKNNRFFENFFDVDTQSLYFNATLKVYCDVLINDQSYFRGYMRLNKVSVIDSKIEYDVSLYSTVGNLFGDIGNNLMKDLDFTDSEYTFNHVFTMSGVTSTYNYSQFSIDGEKPDPYFYPILHNGYLYSGETVNFSGGTLPERTRLYTSTQPIGSFTDQSSLLSQPNYKNFRINSPNNGLFNNQLKPALSVWNLLQLMFKTYNYSVKSDFLNTPWMKALYMYGYFSSNTTKFGYTMGSIPVLPIEDVEIYLMDNPPPNPPGQVYCIPVKKGTGIPVYCSQDISYTCYFVGSAPFVFYPYNYTILANTSGTTMPFPVQTPTIIGAAYVTSPETTTYEGPLSYRPVAPGTNVVIRDNDPVEFGLIIDPNLKQIDFLSSIAKKFNLVFEQDPDIPNGIIIEPYSHYVGTGEIYDWTDKLSFDKGFTVEPALNYVESNLTLTDQEDGDYGNKIFKDRNNRIYGQNDVFNLTDFKSQEKRIETLFSPEIVRQWDTADQPFNGGIKLPLGINYAGSTNVSVDANGREKVNGVYTGVRTKPKLFYNIGTANLFFDTLGEVYDNTKPLKTYQITLTRSDNVSSNSAGFNNIPIISHTMPIGLNDEYKINNDSQSILFNSEEPTDVDVTTYNIYTKNDMYSTFYQSRIDNLYDPNTRFLTGNFYLKLNEYQKLSPKDLIKIQDQYFTWNKINDYNLTNTELTEIELVQSNYNPSTYPTRYFRYQYCDQTGYSFTFKTDFTNENMLDTNFGWSVFYDFNCGILYGTGAPTSGVTSSFKNVITGTTYYVPYTLFEITQDQYETGGYYDWTLDTMRNHLWAINKGPFGSIMPTFWINSNNTKEGFNLFSNCANFASIASTNSISIGSSTYYGPVV